MTYTWAFGDGTPVSHGSSNPATSHIYAGAGSYTAVVTAGNSLEYDSTTTAVTVFALPPVTTTIHLPLLIRDRLFVQ